MDTEIQAKARRAFDEQVRDLRADLHRYAARMVGSAIEGEDVVQDALAKAFYQLSELERVADLRGWLFRVAHNKAIDHLRRYDVKFGEPMIAELPSPEAGDPLERSMLAELGLSYFTKLTTLQRACVILKDVLGYSLREISEILDASVPAIKGALHRGRASLRRFASDAAEDERPELTDAETELLNRYVGCFNDRDFDGLRGMLVEDVRLELVGRFQARGAESVGRYFTNYKRVAELQSVAGWVEGRPALIVRDGPRDPRPYAVLITAEGGLIAAIRDYRYARHVLAEAAYGVAR